MKRRILSSASVALAAMALSACGGSDSSDPVVPPGTVSGQVVDSVVVGLGYQCGSTVSVTDAEGRFYCTAGRTVRFFLGDVSLGTVSARSDLVVTPAMLAGEGNLNLATLLLALDEDGDPGNGLQMPADVDTWFDGQSIDFTNDSEFTDEGPVDNLVEQIVGDVDNDLPDSNTVADHLRQSAREIVSGLYIGTFTEPGISRELALVINRSGKIIGESWMADDPGSQRVEDGYEGEDGYPSLAIRGQSGEPTPKLAARIALAIEEAVNGYGTAESGELLASRNMDTWRAERTIAGALPADPEMVNDVSGAPYQVRLEFAPPEGGEGEGEGEIVILPRDVVFEAMAALTYGTLELFSNGDVALQLGDWHCQGMDTNDPDYSDCDLFDNSYGGEVNNGVVTQTDATNQRVHFVAMDNNILLQGYLQLPQIIEAPMERISLVEEAVQIPSQASIHGTWTILSTDESGPLMGGYTID